MRKRGWLFLIALAVACESTPTPVPASSESCVVAIAVRTHWRNEAAWGYPDIVYFVHMDKKGDPTTVAPVITSNDHGNRVVFLLNAKPGWYAAVAAQEKSEGRDRTTYFPQELIGKTLRKVEAGGFLFLGNYELRQDRVTTSADPAQRHFRPLVEPNWNKANVLTRVFGRSHYFHGKEYRVVDGSDRLVEKSKRYLGKAGWRFSESPQKHRDTEEN